jgi:predicted aldo/keto reductase-like oxidoreductase
MFYNTLGSTGIKVSFIGFGALTLSKLQKNLSLKESRYLLDAAIDYGINFFDTSEFYDNYTHLSYLSKINKNAVIVSKSYAYTKEGARKSVHKALQELDREYIDIFCLHEQESNLTLKGHNDALEEFYKMKEEGLIRAIGMSTHFIKGVKAAMDNPFIEVVQAIVNKDGVGIVDGSMDEMTFALKNLKSSDKGIYAMKVLGGGSLYKDVINSFKFIRNYQYIDSLALGIGDVSELQFAVKYVIDNIEDKELIKKTTSIKRKLYISDWCIGCGECAKKCSQKALTIKDNKAVVDYEKCILCGYCVGVCPQLAIKIF